MLGKPWRWDHQPRINSRNNELEFIADDATYVIRNSRAMRHVGGRHRYRCVASAEVNKLVKIAKSEAEEMHRVVIWLVGVPKLGATAGNDSQREQIPARDSR